jgi:folylpolyglutamate synthase/dihydropteroate synthase
VELQHEFRESIVRLEEERGMQYITSIERTAIAKGLEQGLERGRCEAMQESIATSLDIKFGAAGKRLAARIRKLTDLKQLRALLQVILKADNLTEVRQSLPR